MATEKQIAANRANARKSTGPRSAEGKAASSQNALKSGIHAESQVIRGEDPAALDALTSEYHARFQPASPDERCLVDALIDAEWLLRRLRRAEAQLWEAFLDRLPLTQPPETIIGAAFHNGGLSFGRIERRREILQRTFERNLKTLQELQASRAELEAAQPDDAAIGFVPPADPAPAASSDLPAAASALTPVRKPAPPAESPAAGAPTRPARPSRDLPSVA